MQGLCKDLELKKPTVNNFINLLESTHLIYKLPPFGYGKEILRARYKIYLADAAIAPSVLLKGTSLLEDPVALGIAVETAFFKHVFARYYAQSVGFSYWRGKRDKEVDIVTEVEGRLTPFEVKYRSPHTGAGDLKGLADFCQTRNAPRGYVVTREMGDFSVLPLGLRWRQKLAQCQHELSKFWHLLPVTGSAKPNWMKWPENKRSGLAPASLQIHPDAAAVTHGGCTCLNG